MAPQPRCLALLLLGLPLLAQGFYLPGVAPRAFKDGDNVNMKVQTLVSTETPLQFDFYQLPFCKPSNVVDLPENLGEAIMGDKAHTSAFKITMKKDEYCKTLCRKKYTPQEMGELQDFAILDYRVNMRLDNLPLAEMSTVTFNDKPDKQMQIYQLGYPVGGKLQPEAGQNPDTDTYTLNNHLRFIIEWHPVTDSDMSFGGPSIDGDAGSYIVGYQVIPHSIKHTYRGKWNSTAVPYVKLGTCTQPTDGTFQYHQPQIIDPQEGGEVVYTYDVEWRFSPVKWASRWDVYLQMTDDKIHWFSIINSLVILLFLSGIVGLIMTRILRKDFARYNEAALTEEERQEMNRELREETGWKLVYADVFRAPSLARLLAVYIGSGVQLLVMCILTLCFAAMGFLSPANRGALLSSVLFFFVLMGVPAGYVSARYSKFFKEENHFQTTLMTAMVLYLFHALRGYIFHLSVLALNLSLAHQQTFPGACFFMFFMVNMVEWYQQSSTAVPFGTLVVLTLLWFGVSLPLVFAGAFMGFKSEVFTVPVKTNPIPRQIPPQPWYLSLPFSMVLGGLLPFGAVFVEMFFIISSIWQHRFYYMFGFLMLVFGILALTCAEIAIVLCYLHLCTEEYRWWWRSFLTSGSTAIYMFAYGAYHFSARAHPSAQVDFLSSSVFFGYLLITCYAIFVLTGSLGFLACFAFIKKIYGSIKID